MTIDVQDIAIPIDDLALEGSLAIPKRTAGLVMFAHGSGSSRHSPRNRHVAAISMAASTLAFVLARSLLRGSLERRLGADPRVARIDRAVRKPGLLVVVLLRLPIPNSRRPRGSTG